MLHNAFGLYYKLEVFQIDCYLPDYSPHGVFEFGRFVDQGSYRHKLQETLKYHHIPCKSIVASIKERHVVLEYCVRYQKNHRK